jgi:predicted TIM-barrel fold metal-dependent hydrolase
MGGQGDGAENAVNVDIHCHMFNASDIPVSGFVQHVALHDGLMSAPLAALANRLVSGAPGYAADKARLSAVVGGGPEFAVAAPEEIGAAFEAEVATAVGYLSSAERELIVTQLPGAAGPAGAEGPEALVFSPAVLVRFVRWAKLFCQSRLDLATLYYQFFNGAVDLAVPMLVDLASGVGGSAQTTLAQQIELFELLSRASMMGLIPGAEKLRIHPFVGFDPKRALDDGSTLEKVQDAVIKQGFVGVKVYPEMGWSPFQNTAANAGSPERAQALNEILDEFFGWCADNEVPVTAHCNHSNFPDPNSEAANFGSPDEWLHVLEAHRTLRLNLGHFGGAHDTPQAYDWTWTIANALARYGALYADVGCQRVDDAALMQVHFQVLEKIAETTSMTDRLMFGTDWYMEAINPDANAFLTEYQHRFDAAFGSAQSANFMSANALRFLGFGAGSLTANGRRLRQRYDSLGLTAPSWLGAEAG